MTEQVQQPQTLTLTLNINQVNTVIAGLLKLPLEAALETFNVVQQQAQSQVQQAQVPQGPLSDKVIQ